MIDGIGIDVVDIKRFHESLERTPGLREKLFTESERTLNESSLAARFAAKEAVAKSLGGPAGLSWHDVIVHTDLSGKPSLEITGAALQLANSMAVSRWHISLTHEGGHSIAYVIAES